MAEKRYAIVRVDYNCPKDVFHEFDFCLLSKGKTLEDMCRYCDFLEQKRIIGDTKEQLIKKIATVFSMEKIIVAKDLNEYKYKLAKEIVEFLGVEE